MSSRKPTKAPRKPSASISPLSFTLDSVDGPPPAKKTKTKPMISLANPPKFDLSGILLAAQPKATKGKGRERALPVRGVQNEADNMMWIDKYQPKTEEELAVHKRKVQDARQWLQEAFEGGPSGKLKKYRRILVLTGPAGTAKTATVRVLSDEIGFDILEWRNNMDEQFTRSDDDDWSHGEYESLSEKFQTFLTRASSCRPIFASSIPTIQSTQGSYKSQQLPASAGSFANARSSRRQVILVEDLPNILHSATQASFHAALEAFSTSPENPIGPLVIIISDAGLRGENPEDDGSRWKSRGKEAMDVRNVLPPSLQHSPYVTQISFNPIAVTYMRNALKSLLDRHFASSSAQAGTRPTKDVLDVIVESSNGDIRSAIMALQFACTAQKPTKGRAGKNKGPSASIMLEAVTRREQSLALFHLLGKIMYNKRKGDPPAPSTSAKDARRDQEIDARLKKPPSLPSHLKGHERKASRVDVEMLYADTPIDASLLSLYIHQNYTQYCDTLDKCDALMDSLSWVDASGGETWYQANPHQFHLVVLGTLHALPSPVPRRNQKPFKPAFFEMLRKQHDAEDGVRDVQTWLQGHEPLPVSSWTQRELALGVGTVLSVAETSRRFAERIPTSLHLFSDIKFTRGNGDMAELAEEGDVANEPVEVEREERRPVAVVADDDCPSGAYLSDDDIEDW